MLPTDWKQKSTGPCTDRENEILIMLSTGHEEKSVAKELRISQRTVHKHISQRTVHKHIENAKARLGGVTTHEAICIVDEWRQEQHRLQIEKST